MKTFFVNLGSAQTEIGQLLNSQSEAMAAKDIDRLMSHYSPDVVYFDVVPPLQFVGTSALRTRFLQWFESWEGAFAMEVRDRKIVAGADVAVASRFSRAVGTLKGGRQIGSWVRASSCWLRSDGGWLIAHEHVSWPVDPATGQGVMGLVP
jgi:ketosteroid isomerase-like protein